MIGLNGCFSFLFHMIMKCPILAVCLLAMAPLASHDFHLMENFSRYEGQTQAQINHYPVPIKGLLPAVDTSNRFERKIPIPAVQAMEDQNRQYYHELLDWVKTPKLKKAYPVDMKM